MSSKGWHGPAAASWASWRHNRTRQHAQWLRNRTRQLAKGRCNSRSTQQNNSCKSISAPEQLKRAVLLVQTCAQKRQIGCAAVLFSAAAGTRAIALEKR